MNKEVSNKDIAYKTFKVIVEFNLWVNCRCLSQREDAKKSIETGHQLIFFAKRGIKARPIN